MGKKSNYFFTEDSRDLLKYMKVFSIPDLSIEDVKIIRESMNYEMGSSEPLLGANPPAGGAKIGADVPIYPRIFVFKSAFRNS